MNDSGLLRGSSIWLTLWAGLLALLVGVTSPVAVGQFGPPVVELTLKSSKTQVRPGDQVVIAVILDHEDGWHSHSNNPVVPKEWGDFEAIPTVVEPARQDNDREKAFTPQPGLKFGPAQWPATHDVFVDLVGSGTPAAYPVFEGRAIIYLPVIVEDSVAPGKLAVKMLIQYQACDDTICAQPVKQEHVVELEVVSADAAPATTAPDPAIFGDFDSKIFSDLLSGKVVAAKETLSFDFFGVKLFELESGSTFFLVALLLTAMLGGLILNLTPCVIPVIPIKIMSLSAAAGSPARCFYLGLVTSLGIIAFWLVIGICIASISSFQQVNQLFQKPWFTIGVGVFVAVMAVGMLGAFTINVPQWVYRFMPAAAPKSKDGSSGGSTLGTFLFGVFTAILSTPCTAPFMATASAWAARQPGLVTLATFTAIGVGMALPYAILSAFPKWISKVPRSGPASHLVKQVMGVLMVGVAIFFIGTGIDPMIREPIDPAFRGFWWGVAASIILAMGLLVWKTFAITTRLGQRALWTAVGLALSATGVYMAVHFTDRGPINWVAYTPERYEKARAENKVVVMDFTAEWCLNCKALEAAVLHRDTIVKLLHSEGVVPMKVDLTGNNEAGTDKLKSLNWVGIPLLAVFGPGQAEPEKFDTYTTQTVIDAVDRARGKESGTALKGVTDGPNAGVALVNSSGR
jgi:thiol:disulfide interchange protein